MSELDKKLADSEKHIAEVQRQADDLKHAAQYRPSIVDDKDVSLADRLVAGWATFRDSLSRHPAMRERARDEALKKATGRMKEK